MKLYSLIAFLALPGWSVAHAGEGWTHLFNGKDLTGWQANFGANSFTVEDGLLKVNSTRNCPHLFYVGRNPKTPERFKNFELKAIVRGEPNSNSGIFFHTDEKTSNKKGHLANGYEVQLNTTKKEKRKTGSLYLIKDLSKSPIEDETKWFEIHITVNGKKITVAINGRTVVKYTEPKDPERSAKRSGRVLRAEGGAIALQAHDPKSTFYFKEIKIKKLR